MNQDINLTIGYVLNRPCFRNAKLIAGHQGLQRAIRWVHVVDAHTDQIGNLLNGNELILTTGSGWDTKERRLNFLEQLLDKNVAGICVELGHSFSTLPGDVIDFCMKRQFPLIVFEKEVRFIDITQDINTLITDKHSKMLSDLEKFYRELTQWLYAADSVDKILTHLSAYLNAQVVYWPAFKEPQFFPPLRASDFTEACIQLVKEKQNSIPGDKPSKFYSDGYTGLIQAVSTFENKLADIAIFRSGSHAFEFETMVFEKCVSIIKQEYIHTFYTIEKKRQRDDRFIIDWLEGTISEEEVISYLKGKKLKGRRCAACVVTVNALPQTAQIQFSIYTRALFEQHGFSPFSAYYNNNILFILFDQEHKTHWKDRLAKVIKKMNLSLEHTFTNEVNWGIGKMLDIHDIRKSYFMALSIVKFQEEISAKCTNFFEDHHSLRIMQLLHQQERLNDFINDYIGPLISYDQQHGTDLVQTLKVFLAANGSKQAAAKQLFVVRQTLYHRLEKIEELLGKDFTKPEKRLAIELSLSLYGLMKLHGTAHFA